MSLSSANTGRPPPVRAGYSLVELMIALGILGIGVTMIGTAFPSAMMENKESVQDTMATIIAENAAVICPTSLTHAKMLSQVWPWVDAQAGATVDRFTLHDISQWIALADRAYPTPVGKPSQQGAYTLQIGSSWYRPEDWVENPAGVYYPASRHGWLVAARHVRPNNWQDTDPLPNDYQFVIVPYQKFNRKDRPGLEVLFSDVSVIESNITGGSFGVGGPVILADSGAFAYVTNTAGALTASLGDAGQTLAAKTLTYAGGTESPAIGCYVVRTGLSP